MYLILQIAAGIVLAVVILGIALVLWPVTLAGAVLVGIYYLLPYYSPYTSVGIS